MFLLGNWKSYEELEEELSLDELLATLNAYREQKREEQKFLAALQGVDLSESEPADITDLRGHHAAQQGFGVGMGLGHSVTEVVSS